MTSWSTYNVHCASACAWVGCVDVDGELEAAGRQLPARHRWSGPLRALPHHRPPQPPRLHSESLHEGRSLSHWIGGSLVQICHRELLMWMITRLCPGCKAIHDLQLGISQVVPLIPYCRSEMVIEHWGRLIDYIIRYTSHYLHAYFIDNGFMMPVFLVTSQW